MSDLACAFQGSSQGGDCYASSCGASNPIAAMLATAILGNDTGFQASVQTGVSAPASIIGNAPASSGHGR
jgi:hypothetical protein